MAPFKLEDYEISPEMGFIVPIPDSLPEYFQPWHDLASNMAEFVEKKTMREETLKLPQLDSTRLVDYRDIRLAHVQLTIITAGYTWQNGPEDPPKTIPANIAVPFCELTDRVGLEPGIPNICYINNYRMIDKNKPFSRKNLHLRYPLPGGQHTEDFWTAVMDVESSAGKLMPIIGNILEASKDKDSEKVTLALRDIEKWLDDLIVLSKVFPEVTQPDLFFRTVAAFASGFNEGSGFPDGILFEGVKNNPMRKTLNASAAQSVPMPLLEHILGITYPPEQAALKARWREVWLHSHQRFYDLVKNWPGNVKDMVNQSDDTSDLSIAYKDTLNKLAEFRSYHIQLATRYFILPNSKIRKELEITSPSPMADMIPTLKRFRDASKASASQ